ncbi:MAG: ATP-dependent helicase [Candidatus Nanopelagicaceae bacterium]|nr:ATP-dependent helicase [Candidatus Nanopelagicaceae bacterium]
MAQLAEEILASLDDEQRAVATAVRGPVCVIAGAGTGKTRAITHRLAYAVDIGVVDANRILALTFTARAAGEMRSRLRTLGVPNIAARTFHAAALKQLMYFWPQALGGRFPSLLTSKSGFLGEALDRAGVSATKSPSLLRDISGEIEWAKVMQIPSDEYARSVEEGQRRLPTKSQSKSSGARLGAPDIARVYEAYESLKKQERAIDFEDVLLLTVGMLEEEREIRERIRDQYRYFTVDEYQDVSPLQQRLLDLWLGKREDICVVGDPAQTIYSFAGATPAFLLNFTKKYPDAEVIRLSAGYRSTPEIINLANTILRSGELGHDLDAVNSHGELPKSSAFTSESAELISIAEKVNETIKSGINPQAIAILARTNAQLEAIEDALNLVGIENQIRTAERFFERGNVREMVAAIRSGSVLSDPKGDWLSELRDLLKQFGETDKFARALIQLAHELSSDGIDSMRAFLRELEDRAEQNNPPALPGVTLATLHGAKGLEWDWVFIAGASASNLPWATAPIEEERRLFYVGVTRAKRSLSISYAGEPSPFLREAGLVGA